MFHFYIIKIDDYKQIEEKNKTKEKSLCSVYRPCVCVVLPA